MAREVPPPTYELNPKVEIDHRTIMDKISHSLKEESNIALQNEEREKEEEALFSPIHLFGDHTGKTYIRTCSTLLALLGRLAGRNERHGGPSVHGFVSALHQSAPFHVFLQTFRPIEPARSAGTLASAATGQAMIG